MQRPAQPSPFQSLKNLLRALPRTVWTWCRQKTITAAPLLLPLLATLIALLSVYYAVQWGSNKAVPCRWTDFVHKPPSEHILPLLIAAVALGFLVYQAAKRWPITANLATLLGAPTTLALYFAIQLCDPLSSIVAGMAVAAIVAMASFVWKALTGSVQLPIARLFAHPPDATWNLQELATAIRIALLVYMVIIVLIAFAYDELPSTAQPLLLIFAGIGITATPFLSLEPTFKNLTAWAGMATSLTGSYMQIEHILEEIVDPLNIEIVDPLNIMIVAGVFAFVGFIAFAYQVHRFITVVCLFILATLAVSILITLAGMSPALFIERGCKINQESLLAPAALLLFIAAAFGIAAGLIVVVQLVKNRQPQQPQP